MLVAVIEFLCHVAVMADILLEFLEVAFHSILYVRELYPAAVFHTTKKYNVPVQVSSQYDLGGLH